MKPLIILAALCAAAPAWAQPECFDSNGVYISCQSLTGRLAPNDQECPFATAEHCSKSGLFSGSGAFHTENWRWVLFLVAVVFWAVAGGAFGGAHDASTPEKGGALVLLGCTLTIAGFVCGVLPFLLAGG